MRTKCRVWWPKNLSSSEILSSSSQNLLLFGWFISCCSNSVDVVAAFAYSEDSLSNQCNSASIEEAIHHATEGMPVSLQDKSAFTILGRCVLRQRPNIETVDGEGELSSQGAVLSKRQSVSAENRKQWYCGCAKDDRMLQKNGRLSHGGSTWIQLVIVYETPRFGGHHFSLSFHNPKCGGSVAKRPKWVEELHRKSPNLDLDTVIMAINSSAAAKMFFDRYLGLERSRGQLTIFYMFFRFIWQLSAAAVASFSTLLYIVLQFFRSIAGHGEKFWTCIGLVNIFNNTWKNIHIRCCQLLYWPIFLKESGLRSQACVEYAEKASIQRHSMWSSVAVDIILGNLLGFLLLSQAESICQRVSNFASHVTDDVLRTGCVWLMGVPAGFKLNTELAEVLGIISLNAIQIWSTLWSSSLYIFCYFIKAVGLSGIIFGITVPAALIVDMIGVATLHVSTVQWFISLLYWHQIQALTALWRLFRGRKWNPLRKRLDSYDYSVEQHVVGSLLFTPLLLLLPTTSVFYIFFSMIDITVTFVRVFIEDTVSVIHATPFIKIFLWLVKPKRFPSGIWIDIIRCQSMHQDRKANDKNSVLLSFLHSNILSFGQVVYPHYVNICSGVQGSPFSSTVYGVITGRSCRIQNAPRAELPAAMPWLSISYKEYWRICYDSVIACKL